MLELWQSDSPSTSAVPSERKGVQQVCQDRSFCKIAQIDAIPDDMHHNEIPERKLLPRGTNAITAIRSPIIMPHQSNYPVANGVRTFNGCIGFHELLNPHSLLLKKGLMWEWTTTHEDAFLKARKALSETHDLAFYYQKRPTALQVDASRLRSGIYFEAKGCRWELANGPSRLQVFQRRTHCGSQTARSDPE
ncbi:hypothetical protein OUZ56_003620 [Daphnia magna]|uniref:Reverse transcriptase/retrotransposon-derived protein RNase H-like domain-containing protein n=1 Tax=Daphnia magna TaxID=35525 RepID=A0ABR0A998_9CRUS|nr:hypothetical protein OUZ56_003620 [Daphnia magna]